MATRRASLVEIAAVFGLLGVIGFGGPAAHIALMRRELVERRRWLDDARFVDLVGIVNLLPGPNSTELAMHVGMLRAGLLGLVVAGLAFILPAAVIVLALAWAYVRWGTAPEADALLYGIAPVVVAIVAAAAWSLARAALREPLALVVAVAVCTLALLGANEILLLFGGAMAYLALRGGAEGAGRRWVPAIALIAGAVTAAAVVVSPLTVFATFLRIGSLLFGSGYVLVAFLRGELVDRLGWLTEPQLLDAVAAGQITPGPLFTTATFVGYLVAGVPGAVAATVGIFLPAFVVVALATPFAERLRGAPLTATLLDGVNAAALGLLAAVSLQLARGAVVDLPTALLAAVGLLLIAWRGVSSVSLIAGGAALGLLARALAPA